MFEIVRVMGQTEDVTGQDQGTVRRADARRNMAAILEAAARCLAQDPEASLADIAREAGVGRVTLYGHFDSRPALIAQVLASAMEHSERELGSVDLTGDPRDAMARLLAASWRVTHRHGALVQAAERTLKPAQIHAAHEQPVVRMRALLRRGRRAGCFRTDMPVTWQLTMIQAILHGASASVNRGDHSVDAAAALVGSSVLGALTPPGRGPAGAGA